MSARRNTPINLNSPEQQVHPCWSTIPQNFPQKSNHFRGSRTFPNIIEHPKLLAIKIRIRGEHSTKQYIGGFHRKYATLLQQPLPHILLLGEGNHWQDIH
ncbi:hypothetical protein QL285_042272 [Trifolium repens]|nr:hypothetical protein QL285_042272 [Trifolium repens]